MWYVREIKYKAWKCYIREEDIKWAIVLKIWFVTMTILDNGCWNYFRQSLNIGIKPEWKLPVSEGYLL